MDRRASILSFVVGPALLCVLLTCSDAGMGPGVQISAVTLTPSHATVPAGQVVELRATARDDQGRSVGSTLFTWTSSDSAVARVSPEGVVTSASPGFTTLTATSGSVAGISTLYVLPAATSVTVGPDTTLVASQSVVLHPVVRDSAGDVLPGRPISWSSSDPNVVSISSLGVARAVTPGTAVLTARAEAATGTTTINVRCTEFARIEISLDSVILSVGHGATVAVTSTDASACGAVPNVPVAWTSLDTSVVTVSATGALVGIRVGRTTIVARGSAQSDIGLTDTAIVRVDPRVASVTVVPATVVVAPSAFEFPQAVARDSAGTVLTGHLVTWSSSSAPVASFLHDTLLTQLAGTATITATVDSESGAGSVTVDSLGTGSIPYHTDVLDSTVVPIEVTGLNNLPMTLASTDTTVFTVTPTDTVGSIFTTVTLHGRSVGEARLVVTSRGVSAVGRVTVFTIHVLHVTISPRPPLLHPGDTLSLVADVVPNAPVGWTSSAPSVATVSSQGLVTALSPGRSVITARSEGVTDTLTIYVPQPSAPQITAFSPSPIVAGDTITISGTGFSAAPDSNHVFIRSVAAGVTAATPTSLTVTVPGSPSFPCHSTESVPLHIDRGGEAAETAAVFRVATAHTLGVGDTVRLSGAEAECNEFPADGIYQAAFVNAAGAPAAGVTFRIATNDVVSMAPPRNSRLTAARAGERGSFGPPVPGADRWTRDAAAVDRRWQAANRAVLRWAAHTRAAFGSPPLRLSSPAGSPFQTIRIPLIDTDGSCDRYTEVTTRQVYSGTAVTILEDINTPVAGTASDYASIGANFDAIMFPLLQANVGDPTGSSGKMLLVFSPAVNEFGAGGFVSACDLFPAAVAPASNEHPVVYAFVPTDPGSGFAGGLTTDVWRWLTPEIVMHEAAHLAILGERLPRGAPIEAAWLEEAEADVAQEVWARQVYQNYWKRDLIYRASLYCDVRPTFPECTGHPRALFDLFASLYEFDDSIDARSVLGAPPDVDVVFPGGGWSLVRWAIDQYATSEGDFVRALVDEPTLTGAANLAARTGVPFSSMLEDWTLAADLDDSPIGGLPVRLSFPSWNLHDVFLGMNTDFPDDFPKTYPLPVQSLYYGGVSGTLTLPGGGASFWEPWIPGSTGGRFLFVTSPTGGPPPSNLVVEIVRTE